ncbi:MAG TPA: SGNH/GDSL hydrolase family protein [Steroidobacteraceae bacterium]|jgi:lysophospholipase L1-like esterase|nr:SGNH/GDSL hydrolase family protein [Steroidobacteraceae bacterium]
MISHIWQKIGLPRAGFALCALMAAATLPQRLAQAADATATAQYVALGSSYAAGPGIAPVASGSPARCARSAENYAHLLAARRGLSLVDATCSGATTHDVLRAGQFGLPAQLDAVTAQTQWVTVTIGGNDVYYMANLIAMSCTGSLHCQVRPDEVVNERFKSLADSLREIVNQVRLKSPEAQVIFVTYFTVLPEQGTCARVALTVARADLMRSVATRLADVTRTVAKQTRSGLVDVAALSRMHGACASDPWVLGAGREAGESIPPFHPTRAAMQKVAEALDSYLASKATDQ